MPADLRRLTCMMRVEIWSDVVCPWCYVGTRNFDAAVQRFRAGGDGDDDIDDLEVAYRAFELDPTVPEGGMELADYLARKFGSRGAVAAMHTRLAQAGADAGVDFRWEGMRRANTFDAHRLGVWAEEVGGAEARAVLEQRLFRACFTDNLDVGDHGVLARLAGEAGLDDTVAAEALAADTGADRVRAEEAQATELGISAVPTFVIEGRWAIPGAQDADTFAQILRTAAGRLASRP
ncbi:MAG TPA: DsbA family oxidoreductase [Acidimicrobiales bacterium]|nr:DsbA family oxidoreductase [Acidimicrobiales bacterium]